VPAGKQQAGTGPQDLIAIIDAYHAMWNTHDLDGVPSFFADDAMMTIDPPLLNTPAVHAGEEQIRDFLRLPIPGCEIRARSHHVIDDRVIWMAAMSCNALRDLNVNLVETRIEALFRRGKISTITVTVTRDRRQAESSR
jgi:SnoaL-like domain